MGWVTHVRRWAKQPYAVVANRISSPVLILLYHRVNDLPFDPQRLCVSSDNFHAQMEWLRAHYPIVRFDHAWSTINKPSVCITFDDGYADNFTLALPILERLDMQATFFVATGLIGSCQEFWWDELERLLLLHDAAPAQLTLQVGTERLTWTTRSAPAREAAYRALHHRMRRMHHRGRQQLLDQLRSCLGCDSEGRASHRVLNQPQLRALAASPHACLGAHSIDHDVLATLSATEQQAQIQGSRDRLSELCGQAVSVFSYPYGCRHDFNKSSMAICRNSGFLRTAANIAGLAYPWTNDMRIPRQVVGNWPRAEFASWIKHAWYR